MRKIREITPFVMLGIVLTTSILSKYNFYTEWYKYLPDILGYSLITNLFMLSVYFNGRYCLSTKVAVISLMTLNVLNIIKSAVSIDSNGELIEDSFMFYSGVYDFYATVLASITVLILILNKK